MLDERDIEILQEMFDRSYTRFEDSIIAELRSVREDLEKHLDILVNVINCRFC